jgi:hypothetical protein
MPDRRHDGEGKTNNVNNAWSNSWAARGKYYEKHGKKHATGTVYLPAAYKPGQIVGSYIDWETLMCVPIIPNPVVLKSADDTRDGREEIVKVAGIKDYLDVYTSEAVSDYSLEEQLAFFDFTGNEILQVAKNYNVSSDSQSLNKNILDIVFVANSYSPTEIIKLQSFNGSYFSQFSTTIGTTSYVLDKVFGQVTIEIPVSLATNENFVKIETLTPGGIFDDTIYE